MFKTIDRRTAKSFEQKPEYKVIKQEYGEWLIFLLGEKIPEKFLQAEQKIICRKIVNPKTKEIKRKIRELRKVKKDAPKKSQLRRDLNKQIRELKKQLKG